MANALSAEEIYFANTFVVPNRRERLLWELGRDDKRRDCIWRFAHGARGLLMDSFVHTVVLKNGEYFSGEKKLFSETGRAEVFVVHPDSDWDRRRMAFESAFDEYLGSGPYIMIDSKQRFAFIETESDCETHEFLYIHK